MRIRRQDYYEILGVNRRASSETLRQAYKASLLGAHPDHNPGDANACVRTRLVVEAYKTLSNPTTRRRYDIALARSQHQAVTPASSARQQAYRRRRTAVTLLAAGVLSAALIGGLSLALEDRTPVFRFSLDGRHPEAPSTNPALLVAPLMQDCREWYLTQEYQLAHSNALISGTAAKAYVDALRRSEMAGDQESADFYRASLQEMRRAKNLGVPNTDLPEPGAKAPPDSS